MKKKLPAPSLDSATASQVLVADIGNLLKRVSSGQPLTRAQRELIQAAAGPATPAQPDGQEDRSKPPRSPGELARRLGVSRQRIAAWRQRPDAPPIDDVAAWRRFLGEFARVELKPSDATLKQTPRLNFGDGTYSSLGTFGETLPARLAALAAQAGLAPRPEQLDALALGLFLEHVASMNRILRSWSFEPFEVADYPEQITAIIERLA
jgi:hypothetical protein